MHCSRSRTRRVTGTADRRCALVRNAPGSSGGRLKTIHDMQQVYFDVGLCNEMFRSDRAIGDKSILCTDPAPLGRIVLGLYGNLAPVRVPEIHTWEGELGPQAVIPIPQVTVANLKRAVQSGLYDRTVFSRIFPGEYIQAGVQGSFRMGQVELPRGSDPSTTGLAANSGKAVATRQSAPLGARPEGLAHPVQMCTTRGPSTTESGTSSRGPSPSRSRPLWTTPWWSRGKGRPPCSCTYEWNAPLAHPCTPTWRLSPLPAAATPTCSSSSRRGPVRCRGWTAATLCSDRCWRAWMS